MRKSLVAALILLLSSPAHAGTFGIDGNGQLVWQSNQCSPPPIPPSLVATDSETGADNMNQRATQYNTYVQQAQAYMNCISTEAEIDANRAGQSIIDAGQVVIDKTQKDLQAMAVAVQKQSQ
jgi:hypothetical protein